MSHPTDEAIRNYVRRGWESGSFREHIVHCQPCCNRIAAEAHQVLSEMSGGPTREQVAEMFKPRDAGPAPPVFVNERRTQVKFFR